MPDDLLGRYRCAHDKATRRVFWHGKPRRLFAARTRPNQAEEPAYEIEPAYLTRLISFGCWLQQHPQ